MRNTLIEKLCLGMFLVWISYVLFLTTEIYNLKKENRELHKKLDRQALTN